MSAVVVDFGPGNASATWYNDLDINLVVVAVVAVVAVGGGWWWPPWYNDFDINLAHVSSLASTNTVATVPGRVVSVLSADWRAFGVVVSKLGL